MTRWVGLVISLLLAGAAGCGFAPRRTSIPRGGASAPMRVEDNQPGVEVKINGRGPYRVLLDTGASPALSVSPPVAKELGLRRLPGYVRLRAANGKWVRGARSSVRRIAVGGAVFEDVPAVILDFGEPQFAGVVGMGLFADCVVTFRFPERRLTLLPGRLDATDPDTLAVPFEYGLPLVPVTPPLADGPRPVHVLLDTGSNGGLILPACLRDRLPVLPGYRAQVVGDTLGGSRSIELVKLRGKLGVGHYSAENPVIGLAPGRGAMGTGALLPFDVAIDPRSKRVRLTLRAAATQAATQPATQPATRPSPADR